MKRISKIYLYLSAVLLLAWLLPWTFRFLTTQPVSAPFTVYSCISHSFALKQFDKEKDRITYTDTKGNTYTATEFDSILPLFYYRQLMAKGHLPDTICGIHLPPDKIRHDNFNMRISARDINCTAPRIYMIMESMPPRVDLEEATEAFRMTDAMTFIRMADNTVNQEKSDLFTKVLKQKGFTFPMRGLNGNPTTMKEYDEGYILIDANYQVFHVKQMKGRPYVKNVNTAPSLKMKYVFITEFSGKKTLALLTDEQNNSYALTPQYQLHRLPFSYDPEKESMLIIGDRFNWTVRIADGNGYTTYALDADTYQLVDRLRHNYPTQKSEKIYKALFPFSLSFTSTDNKWVQPQMDDLSAKALPLNTLLAAFLLFVHRKRIKKVIPHGIATIFLGIFVFIPFLLIRN